MAITIAAAQTALNQFANRNSAQIHQSLKQTLEWETMLPFEPMDYAYTGVEMEGGTVLQPYQSQFTPNNNESFDGITNILQIGKVDLKFDEAELIKFFSRFNNEWFQAGNGNDPTIWDYARWVIQNHVLYQVGADLNQSAFTGVFSAPTPGTAGAMIDTFNGWKKGVADMVTASRLTPITTGALVSTTMLAQVRTFCAGIPTNYRYKPGKIFMSKTRAQQYSDDFKAKNSHRDAVRREGPGGQLILKVDDYQKEIIGMTSMEGSDRFICCFNDPKLRSLIVGNRRGYNPYPIFRFEPEDRTLKCFAEIYRVFGFETTKHMFVNEQV